MDNDSNQSIQIVGSFAQLSSFSGSSGFHFEFNLYDLTRFGPGLGLNVKDYSALMSMSKGIVWHIDEQLKGTCLLPTHKSQKVKTV